jgi:predicted transcriptional regulator
MSFEFTATIVAVEVISIHHRRLKLKISQSRLAALYGVSRFRICLYERGDLLLSQAEVNRIDEAIRNEARRIQAEAQKVIDLLV